MQSTVERTPWPETYFIHNMGCVLSLIEGQPNPSPQHFVCLLLHCLVCSEHLTFINKMYIMYMEIHVHSTLAMLEVGRKKGNPDI